MSHATGHGAVLGFLKPLAPFFSGNLGVQIFFVISGFIITTLLLREEAESGAIAVGRFYVRRALRLVPVQLAYLAVLFALTRTTQLQVSACQFATALTYTKNYACGDWVDGHLWSLSVEEQFYLLWPAAIILVPRRWLPAVIAATAVISPVSRAIEYHLGSRNLAWLTSNADALMAGCAAALLFEKRWLRQAVQYAPFAGRLAAVLLMAAPVFLHSRLMLGALTVMIGPLVQALAAAYIICSCIVVRRGLMYAMLNARPMMFLGSISYSLYVWQMLFFSDPASFGFTHSVLLTFPLNIVGAVLTALISYYGLEVPFARLRSKFSGDRLRFAPEGVNR